MIKTAMIGCGKNCGRHFHAFARLEGAKITAVCDVVEENLNAAIRETGACGYTDYTQLLKNEELDLAVINLPHNLHNPCVRACAAAGVDIFLEKPMGLSVADCEEMQEICKAAGVMLWVGHGKSYAPINVRAKELVRSGEYGRLVSMMEIRNMDYFADDRPRWFLDEKKSGGGIMMNLGAHALDKVKFFSEGNIVSAYGGRNIPDGFNVENSAQAFVKTDNGVTALINLIGHTKAVHCVTTLYLTGGEIRIHMNGILEACRSDGVFEKISYDNSLSEMDAQIQTVIETMLAGGKPGIDGEYGKDIIRAIKTVYATEQK